MSGIGESCINFSVFSVPPPGSYSVASPKPTICVGINKTPVKILGKILLDFALEGGKDGGDAVIFRLEINVIENLINPAS